MKVASKGALIALPKGHPPAFSARFNVEAAL
jgi:hypothetical protein